MDAAPRLMLIDKQVSPKGHLANAALDNVRVIKYDSEDTTLAELQQMIRTAHYKHGAPFASIACAQHGCNEEGLWTWTSDLVIDLGGGSPLSPAMQLSPIIEALGATLEKTKLGKAHIDLLACGLAAFAPRLVVGLEKLYGIDIRASTDNTGNDVNGGDWKMETDDDYDVAADYLDRAKLMAYAEVMAKTKTKVTVSYTISPGDKDGHELVKVFVKGKQKKKHVTSGTIQYENRLTAKMTVEHVFPGQCGPGRGQNMPNFENLANVQGTPAGNGYGHALLACMNHRVINNKASRGGDTKNPDYFVSPSMIQACMVGAHFAFVSYSPHRGPHPANEFSLNCGQPEKTGGCQEWTSTYKRTEQAVKRYGVNLTMVCKDAMKTSMNRFQGNKKGTWHNEQGAEVTWFDDNNKAF